MKKSVMTYALVLLVCLWLTSVARATIVTGSQDWYKNLDPDESITCIAFYGLGSVKFTQAPEWVDSEYTPPYNHDITNWQTGLSANQKIAYIYGPLATNLSADPREWFAFELFYQWNDEAEGFDPDWPVYQDMTVYDGPLGSPPTIAMGWRGTPGNPYSWENKDGDPTSGPYQTDEPYENPTPEPMTICLLGLGTALLRKKRKRKALSLSNKEDSHPLC